MRVWIVDDEPFVRELASRVIGSRMPGFEVAGASANAAPLLAHLAEPSAPRVDIVLADVVTARATYGPALAARLGPRGPRVLHLTADGGAATRAAAIRAGAYGVETKPWTPEMLRGWLERVAAGERLFGHEEVRAATPLRSRLATTPANLARAVAGWRGRRTGTPVWSEARVPTVAPASPEPNAAVAATALTSDLAPALAAELAASDELSAMLRAVYMRWQHDDLVKEAHGISGLLSVHGSDEQTGALLIDEAGRSAERLLTAHSRHSRFLRPSPVEPGAPSADLAAAAARAAEVLRGQGREASLIATGGELRVGLEPARLRRIVEASAKHVAGAGGGAVLLEMRAIPSTSTTGPRYVRLRVEVNGSADGAGRTPYSAWSAWDLPWPRGDDVVEALGGVVDDRFRLDLWFPLPADPTFSTPVVRTPRAPDARAEAPLSNVRGAESSASAQLEALASALGDEIAASDDLVRLLTTVGYHWAHDSNNLVSAICGYATTAALANESGAVDTVRLDLADMEQASDRLAGLLRGWMHYVQSPRQRVAAAEGDLRPAAEDGARYHFGLPEREVSHRSGGPLPVAVDTARAHNLVWAAVRAVAAMAEPQARLQVETRAVPATRATPNDVRFGRIRIKARHGKAGPHAYPGWSAPFVRSQLRERDAIEVMAGSRGGEAVVDIWMPLVEP